MGKSKEDYMRRAIRLAKKGMGHVSPNPMVGCVVVKDGTVISEGCHEKFGGYHAERNALLKCGDEAGGADLYVTLEPCCHFGKTPPCTDIILEKGIKRVFVGSMDSNPLVAGKGVKILREHGIYVESGILEKECLDLNEVFFSYIKDKMPFVAMKYAMTLDGKIACQSGDSKWVTGEAARKHVHYLRKRYSGIMVGIQTVILDDPMLNCRIEDNSDPVRIICDTHLRLPMDSALVKTAKEIPTYLVYGEGPKEGKAIDDGRLQEGGRAEDGRTAGFAASDSDNEALDNTEDMLEKLDRYEKAGIKLLPVKIKNGHIDLREMLIKLGHEGIDGILVEGGGTLNASLLTEGLVDRVYAYIAPKLVGGAGAKTPVEGEGILKMKDALCLEDIEVEFLGQNTGLSAFDGNRFQITGGGCDILITGRIRKGGGICLPES